MRRLRIVSVAVLCLVGSLAAPPPAADAHTDVCAGQGTMVTGAPFYYPGLSGPIPTGTNAPFSFSLSTIGLCAFSFSSESMTGVLTGWCGAATGYGVTSSGHYFRFDWLGDEWTMTPISPSIGLDYHLIGSGTMEPDILSGESCFSFGADRFLTTGTWASPLHAETPPPNYPPNAPTQVSPPSGEDWTATEAQVFTIQTTDPESNPYLGRIQVRSASTGALAATYYASPASSGSQATAPALPPLPPGNYTWSADATDDLSPLGEFGSSSASRTLTVAGGSSGDYPSDDCLVGGTVLADGFVAGTYVRLHTKQPDAATTWVCYRTEVGAVRQGGKVIVSSGSPSTPVAPSVDDSAGACVTTPGNLVPGPHPLLSGSVGDPGDPSTYVPFATDIHVSGASAWLCLSAGSVGKRVVVPVPQTGTPPSFLHQVDATASHVPVPPDNPSNVSGTCQSATTGTKAEYAAVRSAAGGLWLHTWQETANRIHICFRSQGTAVTGGRFTVDTTGSGGPTPVLTTSTTDTAPCTLRIAGIDSPTTVDLRRSTSPTDTSGVSYCVIVGTTKVRVTVGATGSATPPQTTLTPDP